MDINKARMIVNYCDKYGHTVSELADKFGYDNVIRATMDLAIARNIVNAADAQKAVAALNDVANRLHVNTYELIEKYA